MNAPADRLIELFNEAKAIPAGISRDGFLAASCGEDEQLRARLLRLLAADELAGEFLAPTPLDRHSAKVTERPGDIIDRYKLLEKIGEGGCGVVYLAEQEKPVRRRVALKIIKLGMDTRQVIARFEAERQALALMDHPNIAKVFDGGATETGRPYFVMEAVRGIKITQFCDQNGFSTEQRLDLFIQVCQAIQHAHQKGIIHRDIKPSNILVTVNDGIALPKVIDFGIAKATEQTLTDKTAYTAFEQFIGTPAYMSPEQAEVTSVDIDTRSDIYSLGVLLYELLSGNTPFDSDRLVAAAVNEIRRVIREREPANPSTRLSTMPRAELTTIASRRSSDAPKLIHRIRGDLDWIAMKCLEKDRARRYETASSLVADLKRHLSNEPVMARPPSRLYRFQKLVRRNKLPFAAALAVAMALILGLLGSTWQAVRARSAEQSVTLERNRAEQQAQLAAQETARAAAVARAARRYAYAAEINVALQALAENNLGRARELLDRQQPQAGEEDLRGFEWRYLWQLCRGDEFATFRDEGANAAVFSPDGKSFAYSAKRIIVRETVSRKVLATLESSASSLSFAPDGQLLASGGAYEVALWDAAKWQKVRTLPKAMHPVLFSPDGRWLLTGVAEGFRVWDTKKWEPVGLCPSAAVRTRRQTRNAVAFSPDNQFLITIASEVTQARGHLRVWHLPDLEELPPLHFEGESPGSVAFSADGKHVLAGLWDGQLLTWEFATRTVLTERKEHTGWVTTVAVPRAGSAFATSSSDRTVSLWDAATGKHLVRLRGHVGEVWSVAISPDGRTVLSGSADGTTKLWNADTRHTAPLLEGWPVVIGFIGGGSQVVAFKNDGMCAWTPHSGRTVNFSLPTTPPLVPGTQPWDFKPGEPVLSLGRSDGTVEFWNPETGVKVAGWSAHADGASAVAFSSDGFRVATGSTKGEMKIWDYATRRHLATLGPVDHPLISLAFTPDGRTLAASGASDRVSLWDVTTGRELLQLPGHGSLVASIAFSPDGTLLATSSLGNDARLWEVPSGRLRATLKGHVQGVIAVAFTPDGKTLATGGMDHKVKLWNVLTHQELATFPVGGLFPTLGFSPDGRTLAVGSVLDARVEILRAPSFDDIQAASMSSPNAE